MCVCGENWQDVGAAHNYRGPRGTTPGTGLQGGWWEQETRRGQKGKSERMLRQEEHAEDTMEAVKAASPELLGRATAGD